MLIAKNQSNGIDASSVLELKDGDVATLVFRSGRALLFYTENWGSYNWEDIGFFKIKYRDDLVYTRPDKDGNLVIPGPGQVQLFGGGAATFKVARAGTATPPAEVPQEAGSNFDVILEQSSDLVNWTPANPGSYSGTETKRFFRTRIVKKS
jgi:hypothetical protein